MLAVLVLAAGCASAPKKQPLPVVFYPAAPELPRIQFLTSYSGLKDIQQQSSFNKFVAGEQQNVRVDKPYGVAMFDGKIYVCDTNKALTVFDLKDSRFYLVQSALAGSGKLQEPLNISIEPDGTKYVSDPVRGQVVVFGKDDEYLKAYGTPGEWRPVDAVTFENRLYVVDIDHGVVKVFDKASGEMVQTIGDKGEQEEKLDHPTNIAFDREGYLYVTDVGRFQIVKFDRDGHFKAAFGRVGDSPGFFARPKGIALDREDHLYAVDAAYSNVQVFNKDGRLLLFVGGAGKDAGKFLLPAKVTIDYDNVKYFQKYVQPDFQVEYLLLVTSQVGDRSVSVLAYGKQKGKQYPSDEELMRLIQEKSKKTPPPNPNPN